MGAQGMQRDNRHVLESILRPSEREGPKREQTMALVRVARRELPILASLEAFSRYLPAEVDPELAEYFQFALLGVSVGFRERNLLSEDEAHLEIISPLLEDIRIVFQRLQQMGAEYDAEEFRFQAYDYGINKVYYLDWRLYLSKTLY